jgi:hypothetical protein
MSAPDRRVSAKRFVSGQDVDQRYPFVKSSQTRPESIATSRSIKTFATNRSIKSVATTLSISPSRSADVSQTATESDLIDLTTPDGPLADSKGHIQSHFAEDLWNRDQFLGTDSGEPISEARRSVTRGCR